MRFMTGVKQIGVSMYELMKYGADTSRHVLGFFFTKDLDSKQLIAIRCINEIIEKC